MVLWRLGHYWPNIEGSAESRRRTLACQAVCEWEVVLGVGGVSASYVGVSGSV